ncbi:MAG: N-acetylmuramoyl-L-alanine amidase [Nitratireductor sp.]|nr:N-acetylmuramoyl-L-alanine amidase [Nitratireductor sp.]
MKPLLAARYFLVTFLVVMLHAAVAPGGVSAWAAPPTVENGGNSAEASQPPNAEPAVVFAGRIAGDNTSTRLFFDFDREIKFSKFFMEKPDRLVIDGPQMLFRFAEPELIEPRGLVSFLRYGAITAQKSRIVVSLAGPAKLNRFEIVEIGEPKKFRLVIDLVPTNPAAFTRAIAEQRALIGTSGEVATKGDRVRVGEKRKGRFTVIVDPGHGGIDGGAKGGDGTREKDLTLAVGRRIAEKVAAAGPFDVKMTREEDVFLSLGERVAFARRSQADLVISVHADSLRQKWVRGATVYTLSKRASDELAHELAESENMSDLIAGLDNPQEEDVVQDILADLTARETNVFSRSFSRILVGRLGKEVNLIKNPQRSAAFVVLKAPEIPSVLVELGYLSNKEDEKLMVKPEWQESVAEQAAAAVVAFFKPRMD